jgi:hypothetical protein
VVQHCGCCAGCKAAAVAKRSSVLQDHIEASNQSLQNALTGATVPALLCNSTRDAPCYCRKEPRCPRISPAKSRSSVRSGTAKDHGDLKPTELTLAYAPRSNADDEAAGAARYAHPWSFRRGVDHFGTPPGKSRQHPEHERHDPPDHFHGGNESAAFSTFAFGMRLARQSRITSHHK